MPCGAEAEADEGALRRWEILLVPVEMIGVDDDDDGDPPFVLGCAEVETVRLKVPITGAT